MKNFGGHLFKWLLIGSLIGNAGLFVFIHLIDEHPRQLLKECMALVDRSKDSSSHIEALSQETLKSFNRLVDVSKQCVTALEGKGNGITPSAQIETSEN